MKLWILSLALILTACQSQKAKNGSTTNISIHGHRGSRGTHPENTLPALQEAVAGGADVLEFDLHLTKDGEAVLSHDAHIPDALCLNAKGKPVKKGPYIRKLTLKQVKSYDCGSLKNTRFSEQTPVPGAKIPTLNEVLEWAKDNAKNTEFNIETKMDATDQKLNPEPEAFARTVISVLKNHGVMERAVLQSFDFSTLHAAKKIDPSLRLSALFEFEKKFCEETKKMGFQFASPYHELLTKEEVDKCHAANIKVAPWTLNDEPTWQKAIELGVAAIITDYPRKLTAYLKR